MQNILLIEPDKNIAATVHEVLNESGCHVEWRAKVDLDFASGGYNLLLIRWDGAPEAYDQIEAVIKRNPELPVVVLSASRSAARAPKGVSETVCIPAGLETLVWVVDRNIRVLKSPGGAKPIPVAAPDEKRNT